MFYSSSVSFAFDKALLFDGGTISRTGWYVKEISPQKFVRQAAKKTGNQTPLDTQYSAVYTPPTQKDNYYDALRPDTAISKQFRTAPNASMHAEHGLSFFIETVSNGSATGFMFDYGVDGRNILSNMALLGIDLGKAGALGLSHGHFDHWGGLIEILQQNRSKIAEGTPLYLGVEAFAQRYSGRFSMEDPAYLGQLDREGIESLGIW